MAITSGATGPGLIDLIDGTIVWKASGGSTMYGVLITSASNIDENDNVRTDYTGEESGAVTATLTLADPTHDSTNNHVEADATNAPLTFSSVTGSQTVSGFVVAKQVGGSPATSDPILCFNGFSTGNLSTTGVDVEVTLHADGVFKITYTEPSAA